MALQLAGLERHGEFVDGADRYNDQVRAELLSMSAASVDRYLAGASPAVEPMRMPGLLQRAYAET